MSRTHCGFAALLALLAATSAASACKCAVVPRAQAIGDAAVVFEGRILQIATHGTAQVTTMSVVRPIKGGSSGQTVKVKSRTQSAACGWDFREGSQTLTVGGESAGRGVLSVRRCTMYNLNP
jgi:hypothetical protein